MSTRTQIYLTEEQRESLEQVRRRKEKTLAEVVREAVDHYLASQHPDPSAALDATFGSARSLKGPSREEWKRRG